MISKKQWKRLNSLNENVNKVKEDFYSHKNFNKFTKALFLYGVNSFLTEGSHLDLVIETKVSKRMKKEKEEIEIIFKERARLMVREKEKEIDRSKFTSKFYFNLFFRKCRDFRSQAEFERSER
jgi:hypothetical protein